LFSNLADATEYDVFHENWIRLGTIKQRVHDCRTQINGMHTRKAPTATPAGGASR
jgi:hypothetical protein